MKKITLFILVIFVSINIFAQTNVPQSVVFSSVVRDANNQLVINTAVSIRLTFKEGGQNGTIVYCALHNAETNQNGFVSLQLNRNVIAVGCNDAPTTPFADIQWQNGDFWMEVEYQMVPGSDFISLGQVELASSFYAFSSGTAERVLTIETDGAVGGDALVYNATTGMFEPSQISSSGSVEWENIENKPEGENIGDILYWDGNAWQNLAKGNNGQYLSVVDGNLIWVYVNNKQIGTVMHHGYTYKTIGIGTQVWMAENLRYLPTVAGPDEVSYILPYYYVYDYDGINVNDAKATSNYEAYGVLYNWTAAQTACPTGWHLPTDAEWTELIDFVGGAANAGEFLKSQSSWDNNGNGTDQYGFTALPGGYRNSNGSFGYIGSYGCWWSATESGTNNAWHRSMHYVSNSVGRADLGREVGCSVRCVRD